jgi:UDP-N-acetylmuramoyl-L-alanyl-D-glutamate--2,6-diaminopimelate ligase
LPYLEKYVAQGGDTVLLEVSSQALADGRLVGLTIPLAVFTGFSPDHIGKAEHPTLRDYFLAKRSLFENYGVVIQRQR